MILRALLTLLLVFGIAAPKAGWLIAHWALGAETLVICTGTQLVTLTLDADGNPVEGSTPQAHDCVFAKGDATAPPALAAAPLATAAPLARTQAPEPGHTTIPTLRGNPARAPPSALS